LGGRTSLLLKKASAAAPSSAAQDATPAVSEVPSSSAHALDAETRAFMGPRPGHHFGKVRIHADERAAGSPLFAAPVLRSGPVLARQPGEDGPQPAGDEATPQPPTVAGPTNTAHAEREREVEAVESGGKSFVLYQTEVRFDGSSSWLAKNPGNMDYTANTVKWGSYDGKKLKWGQHGFAIFPTEEQGMHAVRSFLKEFAGERDIKLMMELFSPAGDQNNPEGYADKVAAKVGVPATTLVKTLNDEQREKFAQAIQVEEGWLVGTSTPRGDPSLPEDIRRR
jgi:hypothetical protein